MTLLDRLVGRLWRRDPERRRRHPSLRTPSCSCPECFQVDRAVWLRDEGTETTWRCERCDVEFVEVRE